MSTITKSNKKIAKNTVILYIRMGITMLISFFTTRITLQVLGVEDYGLNNVIASVVTLFSFINGSLGTAVQRFFSIDIGQNNTSRISSIFGTSLYLHSIVAVITLLIAEIFAIFFLHRLNIPEERMFPAHVVFQISVFALLLNILNVPFAAILRAREEFSKTAVLEIVQSILKLAVLFLLHHVSYDKLITLSLLNLGVTIFYIASITFLAKILYKDIRIILVRDKKLIREMVSFITMLLFTVFALVIDKQGLIMLVNIFFGLTINAAYAIAFSVASILEYFAMNFKQSIVPQMMSAYGSNDMVRMYKLLNLGTKVSFILMCIISVPALFEIDYLLKFWLGTPPKFTSFFTVLVIISINIDSFYYFVYQAVHASGKLKVQQLLVSLSYFCSIILVYIAFQLGGDFYFAVYIPIVFAIIRNIVVLLSAKKVLNFNIQQYSREIILPSVLMLIALSIAASSIRILLENGLLRLIVTTVGNTLLAVILGYFLMLNQQEKFSVKQLVISYKDRL